MKIEELLQCDAATLEKMTDTELLEHFKDVLHVTRPEQQPKRVTNVMQQVAKANPKVIAAMAIASSHGIKIDPSMFAPLKKRK